MSKKLKVTVPAGDLLRQLREIIAMMQRNAASYDDGHELDAKVLSMCLRVLFHDTKSSSSLLRNLNLASGDGRFNKKRILFYDTSGAVNPRNLISHDAFTIQRLGNGGVRYLAPLDEGPLGEGNLVDFDTWWQKIIFVAKPRNDTFSRGELILATANKDGLGHSDPEIDEDYYHLTRLNSMGIRWVEERNGKIVKEEPPRNTPALPAVRQIAHEALKSLALALPGFIESPYVPKPMDQRS